MKFQAMSSLVFAAAVAMSAACGDQGSTFVDGGTHQYDDAAVSVDAAESQPDGGDVDAATSIDAATPDGMSSTPDAAVTPDAAPPQAMWQGAQMIESLTGSAREPLVGVDAAGRAIVAWRNDVQDPDDETRSYGELHARRYDPAIGWGADVLLTPPATEASNAFRFDLAVGPMGDAMVIWTQFHDSAERDDVMVRRFTPGGGWEPSVMLYDGVGTANASGWSRVAVAGDGTAVALYSKRGGDLDLDSQLYARYFVPSSGWAAATPIHVVPSGDALASDVAMDGSGRAVAVWTLHQGGSTVWASRFSAAGGWTAPVELDTEAQNQGARDAEATRLALDASGNAVVVFDAQEENHSVWAVIGTAGGTWQPATRLEDTTRYANEPDVAVDATGKAIALWKSWPEGPGGAVPDIRARRFTPGSGWSAIQEVESFSAGMTSPAIAMSAMGTATAVWIEGGVGVWTSRATSGGAWGAPVKISSSGTGGYDEPAIAAGSADTTVVTWPFDPMPVDGLPTPFDLWANVFR